MALKIIKSLAQDLVKSDGSLVNLTQKLVRASLVIKPAGLIFVSFYVKFFI